MCFFISVLHNSRKLLPFSYWLFPKSCDWPHKIVAGRLVADILSPISDKTFQHIYGGQVALKAKELSIGSLRAQFHTLLQCVHVCLGHVTLSFLRRTTGCAERAINVIMFPCTSASTMFVEVVVVFAVLYWLLYARYVLNTFYETRFFL